MLEFEIGGPRRLRFPCACANNASFSTISVFCSLTRRHTVGHVTPPTKLPSRARNVFPIKPIF